MITRADDPAADAVRGVRCADAPSRERLWAELSSNSTWRRQQAHAGDSAPRRAAAGRSGRAVASYQSRDRSGDPALAVAGRGQRVAAGAATALLALASMRTPRSARRRCARAGRVSRAGVRRTSVFYGGAGRLPIRGSCMRPSWHCSIATSRCPAALLPAPATSDDTYLRQASAFLIAPARTTEQVDALLTSDEPRQRLAGVLAAGFRLTVPPADQRSARRVAAALRVGQCALHDSLCRRDDRLEAARPRGQLHDRPRRWKTVPPQRGGAATVRRACSRGWTMPTTAWHCKPVIFSGCWTIPAPTTWSPSAAPANHRARNWPRHAPWRSSRSGRSARWHDGAAGFDTVHPPEHGPIDLSAPLPTARTARMARVDGGQRFELPPARCGATCASSIPLLPPAEFAGRSARACSRCKAVERFKLWHNGRPADASRDR